MADLISIAHEMVQGDLVSILKDFFSSSLMLYQNKLVFAHLKLFRVTPMYVSNVRFYESEVTYKVTLFTLHFFRNYGPNNLKCYITLGREGLPGTNTLAFIRPIHYLPKNVLPQVLGIRPLRLTYMFHF
jgi:hypothetical protein